MLFLAIVFPVTASAQAELYKPGDQIEYKVPGSYPERWEKGGTYLYATPGGKQPIIREKPNEFYPEGSQRAASWDTIRPMGQGKLVKEEPKDESLAEANENAIPADQGAGAPSACAAMLTENDVLAYFQKNLGDKPFADPAKKERVEKAVGKMARDCGVNFRYIPLSPFATKLEKYGAISTTIFPLQANFGPPTKQAWYLGTWLNNQQSENYYLIIAAKTGFLTINANNTYLWKLYANDPPSSYVKGNWRPATEGEMAVSYQGGAGVVLLKAKEGYDWIVRQDRETTLKGRWIVIANINARAQREYGFQK
jgi:hypothetical protein